MHGAGGGALAGMGHPNFRHGLRSQETQSIRRLVSLLSRAAKELNEGCELLERTL